jgi:hypothetical protein
MGRPNLTNYQVDIRLTNRPVRDMGYNVVGIWEFEFDKYLKGKVAGDII